jgi:hypothetical protein
MLAVGAAVCLMSAQSHATCVQRGTIPRVFVQTDGALTHIGVRDNGSPAIFYDFTTTNSVFINTAVVAEASHLTVQITGGATACGVPVNDVSAGGSVVNILVSP